MESQEGDNSLPSINLQESNAVMEITSEDNNEGGDLQVENIFENNGKRKHTSKAWNHFRRLMVDKTQYAECNYCKTHFKTPLSHGTTHLKKHYERTCKRKPRKMDIRQRWNTHIFNQEDSRHKLPKMVILNDYPLSMIEHIGFRRYSASLQPCFNIISRNTLKNDVLKIYNDEKTKFYKWLDKLKCRIAITTDMWTSNNTKKGFMVVSGYFIDDSWILQNCIKVCLILISQYMMHLEKKIMIFIYLFVGLYMFQLHIQLRCYLIYLLNLSWIGTLIMFSSTLYPTSNFYFTKICDIKLKLDEWVKSPNIMIQCMAEKMLAKYEKHSDACYIMMGVAVSLDPRYKMKLVEFYFPLIYGEMSQFKVDEIRQNCYDLLADYQSRATTSKENILNVGSSGIMGRIPSFCASSLVDPFESDTLEMFDQFVVSSSNPTTLVSITSELDMYLEESVLPRTQNFDILSWWKTNGVKYPNLQKMTRDILAIPVSIVASESVFSSSGRLVCPHRSRLHPTTLEALMCSRYWLWNDMKVKKINVMASEDKNGMSLVRWI
ncbi:hypothetical protein Pfo_003717 [Paulownia fortunei]|nr:hypothetical protein Pfo_003717 [Paulownia fortunei]